MSTLESLPSCSKDTFSNETLLQIISGFEAELEAKNITIAVLKVNAFFDLENFLGRKN